MMKFNNRVLCRVACDMLCLQCDHSTYLLDSHPEIPKKIIEGLSSTLMSHISIVQQQNMFKEYKNVIIFKLFQSFSIFKYSNSLMNSCFAIGFIDNNVLFGSMGYVCAENIFGKNDNL